jgi:hypothetical protein
MTTCLSWAKHFCRSLSLPLSISGLTAADQRTMIVGRAKTPQTNQEWKALPPLGPYYGKDWRIEREGEGAFDPLINRTPAQAAAARLTPRPPNLETYEAALTRDEMNEKIIMEWGPFVLSDIDRGDWINAMIKDHKIAIHTANALLLYPSLESHCPRCTQVHDPRHRNFSGETCVILSDRGRWKWEGSFRANTFITQRNPCTQGIIVRGSTSDVSIACTEATQRWTTSVATLT